MTNQERAALYARMVLKQISGPRMTLEPEQLDVLFHRPSVPGLQDGKMMMMIAEWSRQPEIANFRSWPIAGHPHDSLRSVSLSDSQNLV